MGGHGLEKESAPVSSGGSTALAGIQGKGHPPSGDVVFWSCSIGLSSVLFDWFQGPVKSDRFAPFLWDSVQKNTFALSEGHKATTKPGPPGHGRMVDGHAYSEEPIAFRQAPNERLRLSRGVGVKVKANVHKGLDIINLTTPHLC